MADGGCVGSAPGAAADAVGGVTGGPCGMADGRAACVAGIADVAVDAWEACAAPVLMAVVTNTKSPQTTGLEWPRPGISVFQRTFSVALQRTGASPGATPSADGPRQ